MSVNPEKVPEEKTHKIGKYNVTIVVVGAKGTGAKTSLINYIVNGQMVESGQKPTTDTYHHRFVISKQDFDAKIIDTSGEESESSKESLIKKADVVLLGYSVTSKSSLLELKEYRDLFDKVKKKSAISFGVGNKIDLADEREVTENEAKAFFKRTPFLEVSCKTGKNVEEVFDRALRLCYYTKQYHSELSVPDDCDVTISMLGGGGTGAKSSLIKNLMTGYRVEEYDPTVEDHYFWHFDFQGHDILAEIVDTAGQEEYSSMREQIVLSTDIAIIGYSVLSKSSFEEVKCFYDMVRRVNNDAVIVIVGNGIDDADSRQVKKKEAKALFDSFDVPVQFFETSCVTGENVKEVFNRALELWVEKKQKALSDGDGVKEGNIDEKHKKCIIA